MYIGDFPAMELMTPEGKRSFHELRQVVRGMEAWLRDQGFPCGLQGNEAAVAGQSAGAEDFRWIIPRIVSRLYP